jgi:NitT/TauT family transport system ATP-binding protein
MNNILSIKNLKKIYHTKNDEIEAINDISFDLEEGKFIAIVGPSGCGKSTLLSVLCGLEKKTDGQIDFKDNIKIGYMLQQDALFNFRTILNNCLLGLEISKDLTS